MLRGQPAFVSALPADWCFLLSRRLDTEGQTLSSLHLPGRMGSWNTWASVEEDCRGALGSLARQTSLCITCPSPPGRAVTDLGCTELGQVLVCRGVPGHWGQKVFLRVAFEQKVQNEKQARGDGEEIPSGLSCSVCKGPDVGAHCSWGKDRE